MHRMVNGIKVECTLEEEVEIRAEWATNESLAIKRRAVDLEENKIQAEMQRLLREQAIASLKAKKEI